MTIHGHHMYNLWTSAERACGRGQQKMRRGQLSKFQSGRMGPAPGNIGLLKGMFR